MKSIKILIILFIFITSTTAYSQTHLSVDVDESVYSLLEIAEIKGLLTNLSQVHPYTKAKINSLLKEINSQRNKLTALEKTVLDSALLKYAPPKRDITPFNILKQGQVHFNNKEDAVFPMSFGATFNFEFRGDINSESFHNTNYMEWFFIGDMSTFMSYDLRLGAGVNSINSDAFTPFTYTKLGDGYHINLSGGLTGGGFSTGDKTGTTFSFFFFPELSFEFFDERFHIGLARHRRDIGHGIGNLTLSETARPFEGIDLNLYPAKWFNYHFSIGSLENWFNGSVRSTDTNDNGVIDNNELISQNMLTTQTIEFMPLSWFNISFTNSIIWAKRLEFLYMTPFFFPLVLAQGLTGDHDNASAEITLVFKIPVGVKIYATYFADEFRLNTNMFSDPSLQFAIQGGIQWVIPKLPFTIASFQYTKIEPYTYTHYAQPYVFFDKDYYFDISWTNDGENLGYHLPPNSDEFLFRIKSLPYKNLTVMAQYQYIRHGHGNWEEGEMEGSTTSGGDGGEPAHPYNSTGDKDFLNDGIYEKLHIVTIGASYQFEEIPVKFGVDYSFTTAQNYENIQGNSRMKNVLGLKLQLFPNN